MKKVLKSLIRVISLLFIIFVVIYFIGNVAYENVPEARLAGTDLWEQSQDIRLQIEQKSMIANTLNDSGLNFKKPIIKDTQYGRVVMTVETNGIINLSNEKFNLQAKVKPTLHEGEIKWNCQGTPAEHMSIACK